MQQTHLLEMRPRFQDLVAVGLLGTEKEARVVENLGFGKRLELIRDWVERVKQRGEEEAATASLTVINIILLPPLFQFQCLKG